MKELILVIKVIKYLIQNCRKYSELLNICRFPNILDSLFLPDFFIFFQLSVSSRFLYFLPDFFIFFQLSVSSRFLYFLPDFFIFFQLSVSSRFLYFLPAVTLPFLFTSIIYVALLPTICFTLHFFPRSQQGEA
jgi:hypothetical protein